MSDAEQSRIDRKALDERQGFAVCGIFPVPTAFHR
jgi:hypothetical protein